MTKKVADATGDMSQAIHRSYEGSIRTLNLGTRTIRTADGRIADTFDQEINRTTRVAHPRRVDRERDWGYQRSAVEENMAARRLTDNLEQPEDMRDDIGKSTTHVELVGSDDGESNIYKPIRGEDGSDEIYEQYMKQPGALTSREIAAYRLDEHLGFGRIPPTAMTEGRIFNGKPRGRGMIQQFVKSTFGRKYIKAYPEVQQQQMAVLDYVMGNWDRHAGNYRSVDRDHHLDVVAIDHGRSFPESHRPLDIKVRSEFVAAHKGKTLDEDILRSIRDVDQDRLRAGLGDAGLSSHAIDGALERLNQIKNTGMIPESTNILRMPGQTVPIAEIAKQT
ncbi:hypothetical protein ACLMAJ_32445 [Nocardia sp. KC 131]|uniref:hypothetical protein n=1 Tax=Nocardia arseniciresistens TaxID=3392119 RepID=UPI00398ED24F